VTAEEVDVCAVVVTYNSAHVVSDLLDGLTAALDGLRAEVVVVDNASTDGTPALIAQRTDCRLVQAPNHGYAAGINVGVSACVAQAPVLVLNPDLRLAPGSVRNLLTELRPGVGIVAPLVTDDTGHLVLSMRREPTLRRALGLGSTGRPSLSEYVTDPDAYSERQICDWALGAVLLVDRGCHDELGGWDESFFLYSEETDFCLRARDAGWATCFTPRARAVHIGGQSGQSPRIHSMQILNRVRLYRRRHGALRAWAYLALTFLSEASWVVRGHRHSVTALQALLVPSRRPVELGAGGGLVPS
jgi:N-acetylglucosaminyl-diphospho-decaprenol L-rhamnosyltransferase